MVYMRNLMQSMSLKRKYRARHLLLVATERSERREEVGRMDDGEDETRDSKHPKAS